MLIVVGVVFVGAVTDPNDVEFTHPIGAEQEVHVMVVVQQLVAVPQPAFVL